MLKAIAAAGLMAAMMAGAAHSQDFLTKDKSYESNCLPWDAPGVLDDHYLYSEAMAGSRSTLRRLDVFTGTCDVLTTLPTQTFNAMAASGSWLVAEDGIYNRISVYAKSDWSRHGSIRLTHPADAAAIRGDRLYLFQSVVDADYNRNLTVTVFSLPDLKRLETRAIGRVSEAVSIHATGFLARGFNNKLIDYDFEGGRMRQLDAPYVQEAAVRLDENGREYPTGCPIRVQALSEDYALDTRSCTSLYLIDLRSFTIARTLALPKYVTYADGLVEGGLLYLLEDVPGQPPDYKARQKTQVQVWRLADGQEAGFGSVLEWTRPYRHYQIGDRLMWVDDAGLKRTVTFYRLKP